MGLLFERVAVAGVGLIGGSLALAARRAGLVRHVVGLGRTQANLDVALSRGLIDEARRDPASLGDVDLVVLAVPVRTVIPMLQELAPCLRPGAIVTDVASVKASIVEQAEKILGVERPFVGAHPIAGTEQSGAAAAREDLFRGAPCVLTPLATTDPAAVDRVATLWERVGARVTRMDPVAHDQTLAWTSHLVHVLAYTLAGEIDRAGSRIFDFAGPSLRDATRVAASSPELWRDILLENRVAVGHALTRLTRALESFGGILQAADEPGLLGLLEAGRSARRRLEGVS